MFLEKNTQYCQYANPPLKSQINNFHVMPIKIPTLQNYKNLSLNLGFNLWDLSPGACSISTPDEI